jgi:glycosyltransferase involved in cell wall biosynthesis
MTGHQVTILIPNYKTLELTKLCLRLIRKHTDLSLAKIIVIDNDSADDSLEYLRTLKWIELIERQHIPGEAPALGHSRALDLALSRVETPYVLSIHTDTLVRNNEWLPFLLKQIQSDNNIGGVGSWKLESKSAWKTALKKIERGFQLAYYSIIGKKNHALEGLAHNHFYLRSHCALYRTDLLSKYQTGFSDGEEVAGKVIHRKLLAGGHVMIFLPSEVLLTYMDHINHATTVLNPNLSRNKKSVDKGLRRIQKSLDGFNSASILQDNSLDN